MIDPLTKIATPVGEPMTTRRIGYIFQGLAIHHPRAFGCDLTAYGNRNGLGAKKTSLGVRVAVQHLLDRLGCFVGAVESLC